MSVCERASANLCSLWGWGERKRDGERESRSVGDASRRRFSIFFFLTLFLSVCKGVLKFVCLGSKFSPENRKSPSWGGVGVHMRKSPVDLSPVASSLLQPFFELIECRLQPTLLVARANMVRNSEDVGEKEHVQALTAKTGVERCKIQAWLDSGANESMFKEDPSIANKIMPWKMKIDTAQKGSGIGASQVGVVELQTRDGRQLPGFSKVVFSECLADNLASVGRIAEGGYTIVFNACGSKIYTNKHLRIDGREVHSEERDLTTGLYPITLFTKNSVECGARATVSQVREKLGELLPVARAIIAKRSLARSLVKGKIPKLQLPERADDETLAKLSRLYVREDLDEATRWHQRCGHVGMKYLKRLGIPALREKDLPETLRCDSCIRGKVHRLPHKELHNVKKPIYLPGECIATDQMGPYARSLGGDKYGQIFKDSASTFRWVYTLAKKTESNTVLEKTLVDAKARSGRSLRYLKTDGDGIFTSRAFEDLAMKHGFVHERSPPHDHDGNAEIEREIRTAFEGTATALEASGAPAYLWGEALQHFVFTRNVLPLVPIKDKDGDIEYRSARCVLDPGARPFNLNFLVAFGTMCVCYEAEPQREGGKAPGQKRSFRGAVVGYVLNMSAYKVLDLEKRKIREISFSFTFVQEGFFPFLSKGACGEEDLRPVRFFPTREALLDEREWREYKFDKEEEDEAINDNSIFLITLSEKKETEYPFPTSIFPTSAQKPSVLPPRSQTSETVSTVPGPSISTRPLPGPTDRKSGPEPAQRTLPKPGGGPVSRVGEGEKNKKVDLEISSSEVIPKNFIFPSRDLAHERGGVESKETTHTYPQRERQKPERLSLSFKRRPKKTHNTVCALDKPIEIPPPKTLGDARKSAWWEGYRQAIHEEISNLEKLGCWEVVPLKDVPRHTNILRSKFVFDDKRGPAGELLKFKARLVAMGFTQIEGVDYNDTFASVMITKSFRTLLAIWNLDPLLAMEHWDIKQAFVNAPLEETIFVHPVKDFSPQEGCVLKLKKALYGTKQAAHAWQKFLRGILVGVGGVAHLKDECVFIFREGGGWVFLSTHVDDLFPLFNREGKQIRDKILRELSRFVTVEAKGDLSWALSTKIQRDPEAGVLKISQEEDVNSLLRDLQMTDGEGEDSPCIDTGQGAKIDEEKDFPKTKEEEKELEILPFRETIGKLWWLALISRPDIVFAVHRCACWQNRPSKKLWLWILRIVKYLKKTKDLGLVFERKNFRTQQLMLGVSDASFMGEENSKSRYGNLFFVAGALIHWATSKTSRIVSSSTEAEVHGLVHLGKENLWQKDFHKVLGYFTSTQPTLFLQDNTAAITLSSGGTQHKRSKHFGLEFDIFREYVQLGEVKLEYKPTGELVADLLTKPLPPCKFGPLRDQLMGGGRAQQHFRR